MGYHRAGLAQSRGGYAYRQARGGFLSGIGRAIGRVASTVGRVASVVPGLGIAGAAAGVVGRALAPSSGVMPGGVTLGTVQRPEPGLTGVVHRLVPGGSTGYIKSKRMNAGNAKAARRAIRRIKSVRNLLKSIEAELPRRPAPRGRSPGYITRSEAARALRS